MQIKRSKLIQIIKEEVSAVTLGQWTPDGLRNALLRNDTPRKPDDTDDETWNESIRRCLDGHGEYCPLNYGVDKYVRPAPKKRKRTDLTKLLKPASHYKKKKRKPTNPDWARELAAVRDEGQKLFSAEKGDCPLCDIYKAFSGYGANSLSQMRRQNIIVRNKMARELAKTGRDNLVSYDSAGRLAPLSREVFLSIVKNNNMDFFSGRFDKKDINTMHNLWQGMNDKQRRWLTKQLYR